MDLGELGTPAQLWRRWVLLAAGHAAQGSAEVEIRRPDGSGRIRSGEGWLRMRRMAGNRAVVWGAHPSLVGGADFLERLRDAAPDWSYDVDSGYAAQSVSFLAWHAHGSWSSVPQPVPHELAEVLAPVADDVAVGAWWHRAWPAAETTAVEAVLADPTPAALTAVVGPTAAGRASRQVALGEAWAGHQLSEAATTHLRAQIHAQMRSSPELADRGLPKRPALLRQWARVNATGTPFQHAVCALGPAGRLQHGSGSGLDEARLRSLDNVLLELRIVESEESSGAWLFARVGYDGRQLALDRRFDGWPAWYAPTTDPGPTMSALFAEMEHRTTLWRPAWASLLPTDRY